MEEYALGMELATVNVAGKDNTVNKVRISNNC